MTMALSAPYEAAFGAKRYKKRLAYNIYYFGLRQGHELLRRQGHTIAFAANNYHQKSSKSFKIAVTHRRSKEIKNRNDPFVSAGREVLEEFRRSEDDEDDDALVEHGPGVRTLLLIIVNLIFCLVPIGITKLLGADPFGQASMGPSALGELAIGLAVGVPLALLHAAFHSSQATPAVLDAAEQIRAAQAPLFALDLEPWHVALSVTSTVAAQMFLLPTAKACVGFALGIFDEAMDLATAFLASHFHPSDLGLLRMDTQAEWHSHAEVVLPATSASPTVLVSPAAVRGMEGVTAVASTLALKVAASGAALLSVIQAPSSRVAVFVGFSTWVAYRSGLALFSDARAMERIWGLVETAEREYQELVHSAWLSSSLRRNASGPPRAGSAGPSGKRKDAPAGSWEREEDDEAEGASGQETREPRTERAGRKPGEGWLASGLPLPLPVLPGVPDAPARAPFPASLAGSLKEFMSGRKLSFLAVPVDGQGEPCFSSLPPSSVDEGASTAGGGHGADGVAEGDRWVTLGPEDVRELEQQLYASAEVGSVDEEEEIGKGNHPSCPVAPSLTAAAVAAVTGLGPVGPGSESDASVAAAGSPQCARNTSSKGTGSSSSSSELTPALHARGGLEAPRNSKRLPEGGSDILSHVRAPVAPSSGEETPAGLGRGSAGGSGRRDTSLAKVDSTNPLGQENREPAAVVKQRRKGRLAAVGFIELSRRRADALFLTALAWQEEAAAASQAAAALLAADVLFTCGVWAVTGNLAAAALSLLMASSVDVYNVLQEMQ